MIMITAKISDVSLQRLKEGQRPNKGGFENERMMRLLVGGRSKKVMYDDYCNHLCDKIEEGHFLYVMQELIKLNKLEIIMLSSMLGTMLTVNQLDRFHDAIKSILNSRHLK
jgi:hypothetical protein